MYKASGLYTNKEVGMVLRSAVRMCIAILSFAFTYLLTHFSLRRALFFCFPVRWVKVSRASLELRYVEVLSLKMLSKSVLNLTFCNFQLCPRVRDDLTKVKNLKSTDDKPCDILYTSVKSTLFLLLSKDHNFKVLKHSLYTIFLQTRDHSRKSSLQFLWHILTFW